MQWIAPAEKDTATVTLEKRLWDAADQFRANSGLKSQEYSSPVLGLIFLLFAGVRFAAQHKKLEEAGAGSSRRGSRVDDPLAYHAEGILYLPPESRFSYLLNLPESQNIGSMLNEAMREIEKFNPQLSGVLPKTYYLFTSTLLKQLLKKVSEIPATLDYDAFGRIYEYFLGEFAMSEGQGGGEFYTPSSIVRLLTEIIEPYHGLILDPACGSGGMFVSSACFVSKHKHNPSDELSIYGIEKTDETGRLCRLNLAVHGLEGDVKHGGNINSYYDDPHKATGRFDFVLANPPFNVNAVDKERLKDSVGPGRRFPFGLPRTDNANYLWIQLFYSALNAKGRAGFVMANSASDARASEQELRRQLVESRAVDVMVAVGPNMFYTVTLPCTLWFLDKAKSSISPPSSPALLPEVEGGEEYPSSSRRILPVVEGGKEYPFSSRRILPEGEGGKENSSSSPALLPKVEGGEEYAPSSTRIHTEGEGGGNRRNRADTVLFIDARHIYRQVDRAHRDWTPAQIGFIANLVRLYRSEALDFTLGGEEAKAKIIEVFSGEPPSPSGRRDGNEGAAKHEGAWIVKYRDIPGLCKAATIAEIEAQGWSLNPGRYVGVAPGETLSDEDFKEKLEALNEELERLNAQARELEATIARNVSEILEL
jgi:type I restriction enzyme M protein